MTAQPCFELEKTPLAEAYISDIRDTIKRLAGARIAFTPDDVRASLHPLTREKLDERWPNGRYRYANAIGAEFQQLARAGIITPTGNYQPSVRDSRRGGITKQWRAA